MSRSRRAVRSSRRIGGEWNYIHGCHHDDDNGDQARRRLLPPAVTCGDRKEEKKQAIAALSLFYGAG
eukprot:scaffold1341_cov178-Amphora_coffeaeformis.AAC.18